MLLDDRCLCMRQECRIRSIINYRFAIKLLALDFALIMFALHWCAFHKIYTPQDSIVIVKLIIKSGFKVGGFRIC